MCAVLADAEPWWEPGTRFGYRALTFGFLLGETLRRATGRTVTELLRQVLTAPLGIEDEVCFAVPAPVLPRVARQADGFTANRRLLGVQTLSHDPITGAAALAQITSPVITPSGTRVAGLRLTDPRSLALLHILCVFRLLPDGFTNAVLRRHLAPLLGKDPWPRVSACPSPTLMLRFPVGSKAAYPADPAFITNRYRSAAATAGRAWTGDMRGDAFPLLRNSAKTCKDGR